MMVNSYYGIYQAERGKTAAGRVPGRTGRRMRPGPSPLTTLPGRRGNGEHEGRGVRELGDLLTLAPGVGDLPPDVARSWDRIRRLSLQTLAGAAPADGDLPRLAQELIDELEERRRLILTSRTFAQTRRTYDSLAAELGVSRERVRQLEAASLQQLAGAAAHDRYRPLRWRAASAAQPDRVHAAVIPGAPPWLRNMLSWLAGRPA
jgi:hypothetical protein